MKLPIHRTLLMLFTLLLGLIFNAMMERKMVAHYSRTMQRDAYAISQNLSEMIAPSDYETLDENPFIVGEDTLAPYMALIEHITNCNVYLIDEQHHVTGYFDGVVSCCPATSSRRLRWALWAKRRFSLRKSTGRRT